MSEPAPRRPGREKPTGPRAVEEHYRSIDSAPLEYSVNRPPSATNGALMNFFSLSVLALLITTEIVRRADPAAPRDLVYIYAEGQSAAIPVRLFLLLIATAVAFSLATNWWRRLAVAGEFVTKGLLICLVVDLSAYIGHNLGLFDAEIVGQQLASSLATLFVFPFVICGMPICPQRSIYRGRPDSLACLAALIVPLVVAFVVAAWSSSAPADDRVHAGLGAAGRGRSGHLPGAATVRDHHRDHRVADGPLVTPGRFAPRWRDDPRPQRGPRHRRHHRRRRPGGRRYRRAGTRLCDRQCLHR
jgi:hypothetical protein